MRLNNDCVRDLLLAIEENVGLKEYMSIDSLQLKSYSQDDLQYTALKLEEAGYIKGIVSKFASVSLDVLEKVAAQVITNMISQQIGQ